MDFFLKCSTSFYNQPKNKKIEIGTIDYLILATTIKKTERENIENPLIKIIRQRNGRFIVNVILPKDYPVDL